MENGNQTKWGPPVGRTYLTLATVRENKKKATKGGKRFLQNYEQSENSEQPLIFAICTPFMSSVST